MLVSQLGCWQPDWCLWGWQCMVRKVLERGERQVRPQGESRGTPEPHVHADASSRCAHTVLAHASDCSSSRAGDNVCRSVRCVHACACMGTGGLAGRAG